MDERLRASHRQEPLSVGHAGSVVAPRTGWSGQCHLRQDGRGRLGGNQQLGRRARQIAVTQMREATGGTGRQVTRIEEENVDEMVEGPLAAPLQITREHGPVIVLDRAEALATKGGGRTELVRCDGDARHALPRRLPAHISLIPDSDRSGLCITITVVPTCHDRRSIQIIDSSIWSPLSDRLGPPPERSSRPIITATSFCPAGSPCQYGNRHEVVGRSALWVRSDRAASHPRAPQAAP